MRRKRAKLIAFFLVLCMAIPMFAGLAGLLSAQAASASLNATSKKIYLGTTFQMSIENVDMDTVKSVTWKANRSSIAKVDKNGLVTPVKVGTTTIKCTLKYNNGKSEVLSCTVIVRKRVEATAVKITNVTPDDGNAKSMYVGSTFTVKKTGTPSNTTDSVFFSSDDESIATISTKGVITAKREGVTLIEVRYGQSKTDSLRVGNKAAAKFYLHVIPKPTPTPTPSATPTPSPTPSQAPELPTVTSAKMVGSQELQITFSQPVRKSSVLNGSKLVPSAVMVGRDETATDYGALTASLSTDARILTIRSEGSFSGIYSVVVSDKVISNMGIPFAPYADIMTLKDTTGPIYVGSSIGYNGLVCNINFDEALDISNMTVEGVSGTTDAILTSYLKEPLNYVLSSDKRSLSIDLTGYTTERNLMVTVVLKGIRDSAGNTTSRQLQSVYVRTDTSTKPLASIMKVERISRTEIEATFSAEISSGGVAQFGSYTSYGVIDTENPKLVRYEIPSSYQSITGVQVVVFQAWYNYNATTATVPSESRPVNFTLDTTPPQLLAQEMTNAVVEGRTVCKLILTYDKEIRIATTTQQITARIRNTNGDISSVSPISTTAEVENTIVTYIFDETAMLDNGQFTLTLPAGMVADKLENYSKTVNVTINKNGTTSTNELPAPIAAVQDVNDRNKVTVTFSNKIDAATAEMVQNYYIVYGISSRTHPVAASVVENNDRGATVELTFNKGAFSGNYDASYELFVSGVRGFGGSYQAITGASLVFVAVENTPPKIASNSTFSYGTITMTMSEEVMGTIRVSAVDTATGMTYPGTGIASGKNIYITLEGGVPTSRTVRFTILENNITDLSGNKADFNLNQPYIANAVY